MKYIHALFICLMALASPTLAETDPVPYEEFLAENDISFTASEVVNGGVNSFHWGGAKVGHLVVRLGA
jgi:nitric oxide reductase large subunit